MLLEAGELGGDLFAEVASHNEHPREAEPGDELDVAFEQGFAAKFQEDFVAALGGISEAGSAPGDIKYSVHAVSRLIGLCRWRRSCSFCPDLPEIAFPHKIEPADGGENQIAQAADEGVGDAERIGSADEPRQNDDARFLDAE